MSVSGPHSAPGWAAGLWNSALRLTRSGVAKSRWEKSFLWLCVPLYARSDKAAPLVEDGKTVFGKWCVLGGGGRTEVPNGKRRRTSPLPLPPADRWSRGCVRGAVHCGNPSL